jgi:hypothetical protein
MTEPSAPEPAAAPAAPPRGLTIDGIAEGDLVLLRAVVARVMPDEPRQLNLVIAAPPNFAGDVPKLSCAAALVERLP